MTNSSSPENSRTTSSAILHFISEHTEAISEAITDQYFKKHPDCHGAQKRRILQLCKEDLGHHLNYLQSALSTGIPEIFSSYTTWLRSVLDSRDVDTTHTLDALETLRDILASAEVPGEDRELVRNVVALGISAFRQGRPSDIAAATAADPTPSIDRETVARSLIVNDRTTVAGIVDQAMRQGSGLAAVSVGLIQPAMYEIGRLWQFNNITVAQEHLATAVSQSILAKAFGQAEFKNPVDRRALFTCIEGNFHTLGVRMISDAFEVEGWSVDYLGANTPTDALIQMLDSDSVDLLGLSISMHDQISTLARVIEKIRGELGSDCPPIAIGGLPLNETPNLVPMMQADTWLINAEEVAKQIA